MDRLVLGQVREHLNAEARVQVVGDPPLPRSPNDLGRQAPRNSGLTHDVVGELPGPVQKLIPRHNFVHHSVFERQLGVDPLTCDQGVGRAFDAKQFLNAAVNTIARDRSHVEMGIENDRLLGAECDVAHQADFGVAAGPIQDADRRNFEVIDQRPDI